MENSANLALPYIMPSQAQPHVTYNEAVRMLDALVQLSALDRNRATPPSAPAEGDRHIVGPTAEGWWEGRDGQIAAWQDGAWAYFQPAEGWRAWVAQDAVLLVFRDGQWEPIGGPLQNLDMVGINAAADAVNRLAVSSEAVLLNHDGEGHQLKINKAAPGDTASLLFQTGFSGRAEMGTAGNDDFRFKVSGDGDSWHEAIVIERGTGAVAFPNTVLSAARERLSAHRTYYVRTDGNDGNDGLTNSSGGAFATIGRAIDVAYGEIDLGPFNVTIQLGDGDHTGPVVLRNAQTGLGSVTIRGNAQNPGNTRIVANNAHVIDMLGPVGLTLADLEIARLSGSGRAVLVQNGAQLVFQDTIRLGSSSTAHLTVQFGGVINGNNSHVVIVQNSPRFISAVWGNVGLFNAVIETAGRHYSTAFVESSRCSVLSLNGATFIGPATGTRFRVSTNGVIFTGSGNPSFLPGDASGTVETGGVYE